MMNVAGGISGWQDWNTLCHVFIVITVITGWMNIFFKDLL